MYPIVHPQPLPNNGKRGGDAIKNHRGPIAQKLRVRGHAVDPPRLYGADWVRSALLTIWALGAGNFIVFGGVAGFKHNDTYQALIETFPCPKAIGGTLVLGGLLGVIGVWVDWRRWTKAALIICATWHALLFSYTVPAQWGAFGNSNLVSLFALLVCLFYVVQLIEIWSAPTSEAMHQ